MTKQNELEVGYDMLLVSDYFHTSIISHQNLKPNTCEPYIIRVFMVCLFEIIMVTSIMYTCNKLLVLTLKLGLNEIKLLKPVSYMSLPTSGSFCLITWHNYTHFRNIFFLTFKHTTQNLYVGRKIHIHGFPKKLLYRQLRQGVGGEQWGKQSCQH